jgi:para-nitrobenzyl esterase
MKVVFRILLLFIPIFSFSQPIVKTTAGIIEGSNQDGIAVFKGIPYAKPPVGSLRWKAPEPAESWKGVKKCNAFRASPVQNAPIPFMCWSKEFLIPKEPISEDCLYLNVWTKSADAKHKKPVLIYIYGGGFISGGSACPIYDGEAIAKKDVVFVSFNYRVGVFGFLSHPELSKESSYNSSGNYALLDMISALKWVQKNIAAFGGDPTKVTIAGQSAGAFAVNFLCASPLAKGLFTRAIAQSGGSVLPSAIRPSIKLNEAEAMGVDFAKKLNCSSITELRMKSAAEIQASNSGLRAPFEDGYVLPISIYNIYSTGIQNDVDLMLGWNEDDKIMGKPLNAVDYKAQISKRFGESTNTVLSLYPGSNDAEAAKSQGDMSRDETFAVQGYAWANLQKASGKRPVYVYNFNRGLPYYTPETNFGAFHSGEIVYAFNNLHTLDRPWEKIDHQLAETMSDYWVNFVKTGSPNGASLVNWPKYDLDKGDVLIFDKKTESTSLPTRNQLKFLEGYSLSNMKK